MWLRRWRRGGARRAKSGLQRHLLESNDHTLDRPTHRLQLIHGGEHSLAEADLIRCAENVRARREGREANA